MSENTAKGLRYFERPEYKASIAELRREEAAMRALRSEVQYHLNALPDRDELGYTYVDTSPLYMPEESVVRLALDLGIDVPDNLFCLYGE